MARTETARRILAAGCAAAVSLTPLGGLAQSPPAAAKTPDQSEVTTVSPLVVSPGNTLGPLPNLTAQQLGEEAQKARDQAVGLLWSSCDKQDSEAEGDRTLDALLNTQARAQAWLQTAALDAQAAVKNAEDVRANGTPQEIAEAEELRVTGLREYQSAQIIATEAHQRVVDVQTPGLLSSLAVLWDFHLMAGGPTLLDELTRRRLAQNAEATQAGLPKMYVPEFEDLRLSDVVARQVPLQGGEMELRISGRIVNPRQAAIAIPPLWFTLLDEDGQGLTSQQAQAPVFSGKIAAGASRAFTFDFRRAPKGAVRAVATFAPRERAGTGLRSDFELKCKAPSQQLADLELGATPPPNAPWITGIAATRGPNQQLWVVREHVYGVRQSWLPPFHPPSPLVRGPNTPEEITDPKWLKQPTPGDILAVLPNRGRNLTQDLHATVSCLVADDGILRDCAVVSETPPSMHFGDKALSLISRYQMRPLLPNGAPVTGAKVTIAFDFKASLNNVLRRQAIDPPLSSR